MLFKIRVTVAAFFCLAFLVGCGGGGGGGDDGPSAGGGVTATPSSVTFNGPANGGPLSQTVQIDWTISGVYAIQIGYIPGQTMPSWLQVPGASNSKPVNVSITVDPSGLSVGTYSFTLRAVAVNSQSTPLDYVDFVVTLQVT